MTDYQALLQRTWGEVSEPKVLPSGSYELKVRGASVQMPKEEGKKASFVFVYEAVEPMDDVSQSALDELGPDYKIGTNRLYVRFWIEDDLDLSKVRRHIAAHGVEVDPTKPINDPDTLKSLRGQHVVAFLTQEVVNNKKTGETYQQNNLANFHAITIH